MKITGDMLREALETSHEVGELEKLMATSTEELMKKANKFHDHLDVCRQCREEPFNLCLHGSSLLHEFAANKPDGKEPRL